jgi:hypothetical protein
MKRCKSARSTCRNPDYVLPVVDPDIPRYLETPVNVRVHYTFKALGDMQGTNFHFAQREETMPRIVFLRSEIAAPARSAVVSISSDEAYRVDNTLPPDGLTVTAEALRLSASQITAGEYAVPEAA